MSIIPYIKIGLMSSICVISFSSQMALAQSNDSEFLPVIPKHIICLERLSDRECVKVKYTDNDKDGKISRVEFRQTYDGLFDVLFSKKKSTQYSSPHLSSRTMPPFSYQERMARTLSSRTKEFSDAGSVVFFEELTELPVTTFGEDTNDDSYVSQDEFLASQKNIFAEMDRNNDGRLSLNELRSVSPF